jgi:hypothetical protein
VTFDEAVCESATITEIVGAVSVTKPVYVGN